VPAAGLDLVIEPWLEAQEMRTSFVYWEGAVRVTGASRLVVSPSQARLPSRTPAERPVTGSGYVELTGYGTPLQGVF
jgi:predicted secreted hydrolase